MARPMRPVVPSRLTPVLVFSLFLLFPTLWLGCGGGTLTADGDSDRQGDSELFMGDGPEPMVDGGPQGSDSDTGTGDTGIAPEPSLVAPSLPTTRNSALSDAVLFLFEGSDPVQIGVETEAMDSRRLGVVRGRVLRRSGEPFVGAVLTVHGRPEYGHTLSREDGEFDLAVNGGETLVIEYQSSSLLPVQRTVYVPWQQFVTVEDVVLTALDPQVTAIAANSPTHQVAQSSVVSDADGDRQATLLFRPETQAEMIVDGVAQPLSEMNVRVTEYSVGPEGPKAMPGALPPSSGYTYASEFSVDEAIEAGATEVRFSQPVISYVNNFLGFPPGTVVPSGYYDRQRNAWIPSENGRVIAIVGINGGLADLDTDGMGNLDAELGITDEERAELASLYAAGTSLWRVRLTHFTPWDFNWPFGPPAGARAPNHPLPNPSADDDPCTRPGSIIGCESQTLGEDISISGTPFSLHYQSNRVRGRTTDEMVFPLSGATLPDNVIGIEIVLRVAGQRIHASYPPEAGLVHRFQWNGRDVYGRQLYGPEILYGQIGYRYRGVYLRPRLFSGGTGTTGAPAFGSSSFEGTPISGDRARQEVTLWQQWQIPAAKSFGDARGLGFGGWSLSAHHVYDPQTRILHRGDGRTTTGVTAEQLITRQSLGTFAEILTTAAGGPPYSNEDGFSALGINLYAAYVVVDAAGNLIYSDPVLRKVRRITTDGVVETVAGTGESGSGGDGGPALEATISSPEALALGPNGSLYFFDSGTRRVRRIGADGVITTIAGGVDHIPETFTGDGGPATQATLSNRVDIAVASDGTLYLADAENKRIRRVSPDGIIQTIAGNGSAGLPDENIPAAQAHLPLSSIALGLQGEIYVGVVGAIRRIGPDGFIRTIAGNPAVTGFSGDGGPAQDATLSPPVRPAVGPDGSLYITDQHNHRIRRVGLDGIINTIAGTGDVGMDGEGGPPRAAQLYSPWGVAFGHDGSLYIADVSNRRIRHMVWARPWMPRVETRIASEGGDEVFTFAPDGRHLRTVDALTGSTRYEFGYNDDDVLESVTDGDGQVTVFERDADGSLTAIVAPGGQRTVVTMNSDHYLGSVADPSGAATSLSYGPDGLLTALTDPLGYTHTFTYEGGRLLRDTNPAGGSSSLVLQNSGTIDLVTGLGRVTTFISVRTVAGSLMRATISPGGEEQVLTTHPDGTTVLEYADGSVIESTMKPDPRFGMQAAFIGSERVTMPSGLLKETSRVRTAVLIGESDPFSIFQLTETVTTNGLSSSSLYDGPTRTVTDFSAGFRQRVTELDEQGRVTRIAKNGLAPTTYSYGADGRIHEVVQDPDGTPRTIRMTYDASGELATVTDPEGRTMSYTRDASGRVTGLTLPDGRVMASSYDAVGNVTSIVPPGRTPHAFAYSAIRDETAYTPPLSSATLMNYDLDGAPLTVTRGGALVTSSYDDAGRLTSIDLARGTLSFAYLAASGLLLSTLSPDGVEVTHTYDGPLVTKMSWGGLVVGAVDFAYNNLFQLSSVSVNGTPVTYGYDGDGLLTAAGAMTVSRDFTTGLITSTTLSSTTETFSHNVFAEMTGVLARVGGSTLMSLQYQRSPSGRVTRLTETLSGVTTTYDYGYDLAGRLEHVDRNGASYRSYAYDGNGNHLEVINEAGTVTAGVYDEEDRASSVGDVTFTYAASGEVAMRSDASGTTEYIHDELGNLIEVVLPSGQTIQYAIDGAGRRAGKAVDGALVSGYLYQNAFNVVAELDGVGDVVSRFVYGTHGNVPNYMEKDGVTYRIYSDLIGSVRLVVNAMTGAVIQRLDYDPFGAVILDTNPGFQPFAFAGGLFDTDTGLLHFGAREYDPRVRRWMEKDPLRFNSGDPNFYAYVTNDPIGRIDPSGASASPCTALRQLVDFDQNNGMARTLDDYHPLSSKLPDLNNNYDSVDGPVDIDWMFRSTAGLQFGPIGTQLAYAGGKATWNAISNWGALVTGDHSMSKTLDSWLDPGNMNAPSAAWNYVNKYKSLAKQFEPALKKCDEEEPRPTKSPCGE